MSETIHYSIEVEPGAIAENEAALIKGLVAFNTVHAGPENYRRLSIALRHDESGVVGGVSGEISWDWLFIKLLWVSETLRGQGFGRSLMARLEQEARQRGCTRAYVDTFSFQARGFYERLGYEVFGRLDDYPPGHTRYFLQKRRLQPEALPTEG